MTVSLSSKANIIQFFFDSRGAGSGGRASYHHSYFSPEEIQPCQQCLQPVARQLFFLATCVDLHFLLSSYAHPMPVSLVSPFCKFREATKVFLCNLLSLPAARLASCIATVLIAICGLIRSFNIFVASNCGNFFGYFIYSDSIVAIVFWQSSLNTRQREGL